jgi:hypothetical protein
MLYIEAAFSAAATAQPDGIGHTLLIIGLVLLGLAMIAGAVLFIISIKLGLRGVSIVLKNLFSNLVKGAKESVKEPIAGFVYDKAQDIFYSNMNAWQRQYGYCRLYDEASALMSMIIDCEPVYFDYAGKHWLIEFWKGQYGMTTGCEAGVYNTTGPELKIPGIFYGTFYNCASASDMLNIYYELYKGGRMLFRRTGRHWWLTGFVLAEFSEPRELTARISIVLKDRSMLAAFLAGMKEAGYSEQELKVSGNAVSFVFDKPHTAQPYTRSKEISHFMQRKNKALCDRFNELTGSEDNSPAKIEAIKELDPSLFSEIIDIGGTKKIFGKYKMLERFLPKA